MRLIRGAASSGKTNLVLGEFRQAVHEGRRDIRLIVPTATLVRHFQHELARDGCVFPPDLVLTLHRFVIERAPGCTLVSDALLRAIIRNCAGETVTEGLVDTVAEAITLFENAGVTPQFRYWRQISAGIRSAGCHTRLEVLRAAAKHGEPLRLWLDGFCDFSEAEEQYLKALSKTCEVTITLGVRQRFLSAAGLQPAQLTFEDQEIELQGSARRPQTAIIEAKTPEREAAEIARRIVELHAAGTPLHRIAVAIRNASLYVPLLRATFERFRIPARFFFTEPLRSHPVARFLNGLIDAAPGHWDFAATIDCLRSHPRWGRGAEFDRFDFAVRKVMPGQGGEALVACCEREWLRDEIRKCLAVDAWTAERHSPAEWVTRFEEFATGLYRPGRLEPAHDRTGLAAARSHVAALESWLEAVRAIRGFWPDQNQAIPLEAFWRVARPAIEDAVWQAPDNRAEAVQVMSAYEARQWDLSALFVCGVADGDYPQRKLPNPFFTGAVVIEAGLKVPDHAAQEEALFDSLKTRASDFLYFTWPRHNSAGKGVERSRYLDGLATEFAIPARPLPGPARETAPVAGRIAAPELLHQMSGLHVTISMTRLEDLAQCRFKFFSARTLGLEGRPDPPGERLGPRLTGLILHKTMEQWLLARDRDFVEHFEQAFEEVCREDHIPPGYRLEVERMALHEIARKISANERWKPDHSEIEKDLDLSFPGGIRITGRADRIDTFDAYPGKCVIVDYKSGKLAGVARLVESRTKLQGPLYTLAVREQLGLNPAAMVFWAVREDQLFGWGAVPGTDLAFREMSPGWATNVRAAIEDRLAHYLEGAVHAQPEDADQCRWCDFAGACRIEERKLVTIEAAHGG